MKILHIEADRFLQRTLKLNFEREGHSVKLAQDFATAYAEIEGATQYDLILLGTISKSRTKVVELIKRTRNLPHRATTPIIISASADWIEDALVAGATDTFPHPADTAAMMTTIAKHLCF